MLEVMSEEEITLWKSYNTDEGMIKWIAEGGLQKAQAEWVREVSSEKHLSLIELEGSMADLPLQSQDNSITFDENDEIIIKQETEKLKDIFDDLKLLQHNPQMYVHYFADDGTGDFSEEGKTHIMAVLSRMTEKTKRVAYLKALLEWRRVVGGTNVDRDDDWTLAKMLAQQDAQGGGAGAAPQARRQRQAQGWR